MRSPTLSYTMAFSAILVTIAMIQFPKEAFDSAILGLNLWWDVVFPALLPFFILSELLMGLGVVHFIGVLLEPLMRPLFNVPGVGAFALSMGLASGYPMDAVITCNFRKKNLCSAVEAERLLSFTNTADPLFMFGAVAVGMFGLPELGVTLAIAHYVASFLVGFIFRFHGRKRDLPLPKQSIYTENLILRAFRSLYQAKQEDGRSFGKLLGDSVTSSMNTILLIGGFIILFSVFLRMITVIGITDYLALFFSFLLQLIGYETSLATALVSGLFEIDLGALAASQCDAPLTQKVAVAGAIIAWSGLSVHGQVASIVIESGIRMTPYMVARVIHAALAGILTVLLLDSPLSSFLVIPTAAFHYSWFSHTEQVSLTLFMFTAGLVFLSLSLHLFQKVYHKIKK